MPGELIVLNGTSSAGKTVLAAEMQRQFGEQGQCWVIFGIDDFLGKLPAPWIEYFDTGAHASEGIRFTRSGDDVVVRAGPVGRALLAVYRQSMAALARGGLNVIVDEVVLDEEAWAQWETELRDLRPFWVRVDCPTEVCEERERARGDRLLGLARSQAKRVHREPSYHFTVDTSTARPGVLANAIIAAHAGGR